MIDSLPYTQIDKSLKESILEFYPNGNISRFIQKENGKKNGYDLKYTSDGTRLYKKPYKDDLLNGRLEINNSDGTPQKISYFLNNQQNGPERNYSKNGKFISQYYYQSGKKNSYSFIYNEEGALVQQGFYAQDKQEGEVLDFYPDGKLKAQAHFSAGIKQGKFTRYYEDGETIECEEIYENDLLTGSTYNYRRDGSLEKETLYDAGIKKREDIYYPNGFLARETHFSGRPNGYNYESGMKIKFDEQGTIISEEFMHETPCTRIEEMQKILEKFKAEKDELLTSDRMTANRNGKYLTANLS